MLVVDDATGMVADSMLCEQEAPAAHLEYAAGIALHRMPYSSSQKLPVLPPSVARWTSTVQWPHLRSKGRADGGRHLAATLDVPRTALAGRSPSMTLTVLQRCDFPRFNQRKLPSATQTARWRPVRRCVKSCVSWGTETLCLKYMNTEVHARRALNSHGETAGVPCSYCLASDPSETSGGDVRC